LDQVQVVFRIGIVLFYFDGTEINIGESVKTTVMI